VRVRWLGRSASGDALRVQRECPRAVGVGGQGTVLRLEHEPVFTLGRNASPEDVLMDESRRQAEGVEVIETDRGGKVTYHGPGQLVGYPILNLDPDRRDVKAYVTDLEETLIRTLTAYGISGARSPRKDRITSVWVGNDKIAAIGVHISRWITTHGFALNVSDEPLARFGGIVPCGITDGGVTSIERVLGRAPALTEVAGRLVPEFARVFGREIIAA
jgi:lipoyl(octanoyl) transferase